MTTAPERKKPVSGYKKNYKVVPLESLGNPKLRIRINKIYNQAKGNLKND